MLAIKSARTLALVLGLLTADEAAAETVRSHSDAIWHTQSECWATVWPIMDVFLQHFAYGRRVIDTSDHREYEILDRDLRRVLLTGCMRHPKNPQVFIRYLEIRISEQK
jgi:hypothetical protein